MTSDGGTTEIINKNGGNNSFEQVAIGKPQVTQLVVTMEGSGAVTTPLTCGMGGQGKGGMGGQGKGGMGGRGKGGMGGKEKGGMGGKGMGMNGKGMGMGGMVDYHDAPCKRY